MEDQLRKYKSIAAWLEDYQRHWENDPELEFKLGALQKFCVFVGKDPDIIINDCLKQVEDGMRIRTKQRRLYMEAIKVFEDSLEPSQKRKWGNAVRSFFIHNGVAMITDTI
jgi:hypothetical protein